MNSYTMAIVEPALPLTEADMKLLEECGADFDQQDNGRYYVSFNEYMSCTSIGEPDGPISGDITIEEILQNVLKRLDVDEYPHINIEGALTADRISPGMVGGFVTLITRENIYSKYTSEVLGELMNQADVDLLGYSHEGPDYPLSDWKYEVNNDDTRKGYRDWVRDKKEENR